MSAGRPPWDFGYAPARPAAGPAEPARMLVAATPTAVDPARLAAAMGEGVRAETLIARAPLFWTRLVLPSAEHPTAVDEALRRAGIDLRYVASGERPAVSLAPPLALRPTDVARAGDGWRTRPAPARGAPRIADTPGTWFLRGDEGGVAVDRSLGAGAGTRLAVVDDDALEAEALDLDAEVLLGVASPPRHGAHGALMVGWAVGARGHPGVAPAASPRLYVIPKPGGSVVELPLAVACAALDGADVILCATYVEGSTSAMLDDALEVAVRLGRRGRGAAVVLPTGREASSAPGSLHAAFSLGLGEPASDPRVFCVAPGARGGGWFFWQDRRGRFRPFANRGPAVRWIAPGDDLAYPFTPPGALERLFHAESSGASAVAAGVLLLVLEANPTLRLAELGALVDATLSPVPDHRPQPLADPADVLPSGRDRDGHDARHGAGLLQAGDACLAAADPIAAGLLAMGEGAAARAWASTPESHRACSRRLARWASRTVLADAEASQALRVLLRHLRLVSVDPARSRAHGQGVLVARVAQLLRRLAAARLAAPPSVRAEIGEDLRRIEALDGDGVAAFEAALQAIAARCFASASTSG